MTLKTCSCCHRKLTTKTVTKRGRAPFDGHDLLYLNCMNCGSTIVLVSPPVPRQKSA